MTTDRLDIRPFENAVARLEEGISEYQADPTRTLLRDGVIQRFEFTYELAHKTLKRFLEFVSPNPAQYDQMSFQDLIRSGNELGLLLSDWPTWRRYREMRSKTSHTYDEGVALEVVAGIPAFLEEARHLRDALKARLT
ncbi:nucleotidyltransferase substrate binding protein [Chloracidobacterium thermophilum]|jgi:nucleotidyltransferase substrate binding protein (TIGR01987 family)|uniref:Nucleotidyltransferase substrate binding protein, HI0074 family n=1 Tax=Chloracidobacterium thermophilum (strain B) TaxID=981222 RepID=G2LKT7_CHLTF|nr:nucleotidyltransferase substrate binding protein [Chloracidobacterium thermophilum]AEP13292.1 nucleotidyltransferase substrate binding protein, HI0074 family [Chloracidobacterium thermophilum B]QUV80573.1 nucleotidyltransferase substrate binding protein [Chloracidobacterium thermophilum]